MEAMNNRLRPHRLDSRSMYVCGILCFAYVYVAVDLVGIPGLSRLASVFCIMLLGTLLTGVLHRRLRLGDWVILLLMFYLYSIALSLGEVSGGAVSVGMLFTVWVGCTAVGVAVQNGVSKLLIVYAGALALLSSFIHCQSMWMRRL